MTDIRHEVVAWTVEECGESLVELHDAVALAATELASNVVQHAYDGAPGDVEVELAVHGRTLCVIVRDWGKGFRQTRNPGMGLGMELVRHLAAFVDVRSADCTEIEARFPVAGLDPHR